MINFMANNLFWTEGSHVLLVLIGLMLVGSYWYRPLCYVSFGFMVFCFYFFRNPDRICPEAVHNPHVIVCPADGKIIDIKHDVEGYAQRVSIFLSIFDVHVTWAPIDGVIESVAYQPGMFSLAFLSKSSTHNERNDIVISHEGLRIKVRQIAGMVARRVRCWVVQGQHVASGDKIGMIRFGSRVDLFLPANVELHVGLGQRVYGGQTVIGYVT